ncbi:DNA-binding barrel domain superfamily [Sesbania bispinosa]|nr:DNA-binding barrel domain superfamily [Sesbania bispinosa]
MARRKEVISISSDSESEDHNETDPKTWVANNEKAKCSGRQTLVVCPKRIRDSWFAHEPDFMFVKYPEVPQGDHELWELKWHKDPRVCLIGHGWDEFCKWFNLKTKDKVCFTKKIIHICSL